MRYIVLGLVVSLLALTFATRSTHADNVTGTVSDVGTNCFDYNLTVNNTDKGAAITGLIAYVTWTPDGGTHVCPGTGPSAAPAGWSRESEDVGASSDLVKWGAKTSKSAIKNGSSLSGFIVRVEACPVLVELWTTYQQNGNQTAAGSFTIPCPPP